MSEIAKNHHSARAWAEVVRRIRSEIDARRLNAADAVVLVPYAQLMHEARAAWLLVEATDGRAAGFIPRFETSQNWARSIGCGLPGPQDLTLDPARDLLTAQGLLRNAGLREQRRALGQPLMEAAFGLARHAAAVHPLQRNAWGQRMAAMIGTTDPESPLHLDAWIGRIAVAWASSSTYPSDVLFDQQPALLVVVRGFQTEPLALALVEQAPGPCLLLDLDLPAPEGRVALHAAGDAEDEAERAAACVLHHLDAGRHPVALVAQDRMLVRRIRAMLADRAVSVRDETGWTLATTRSAAALMALIRALASESGGDDVLDGVKHAPAIDAMDVVRLEAIMRRKGLLRWGSLPQDDPVVVRLKPWRELMAAPRPVTDWLNGLRLVLQEAGLWTALECDAAGRVVLDAACLRPAAAQSLFALTERMSQGAFVRWLTQVLEAGSFVPPHPPSADVVILPLAQLLGRSPAAVVFPGADESGFKLVPDRTGPWTAAQRVALGLGTRTEMAAQTEAAWHSALRAPFVDVLWRTSQRGEAVMASPLVLARQLARDDQGEDPRSPRDLLPVPMVMPGPEGQALPLTRVSASAYADLRQCPYRYFAARLLNLDSADEIDEELDKRDFGQWIHALLAEFHRTLALDPEASRMTREALADAAAEQAVQALRLSDAEFLPYRASWPRVRDAYLDWLADHEKAGHRFVAGEQARERALDAVVLHGRLDRLDRAADGGLVLLDYKTESGQRVADRVKSGSEDVQLPFYAALLAQPPGAASYLSIAEGAVKAHAHHDIEAASECLVKGLQTDLLRIASGAPLRALGVGQACTYCRSRGLCRKDNWAVATGEAPANA